MPPRRNEKCKLPIPLPEGKVLDDIEGKQWVLGRMIGSGGFGLIYLAFPTNKPNKDARHVIKVEYQENGPLFSELKFYQRAAKKEYIRKWIERKQLDYLGIPLFYGFGLTEFKGRSYRFMVMERLGTDLQKISDQNGPFIKSTVLQLGIRMLDILEYIHENEYVHGDIKAANLLLGYTNPDRVYLADYGLSYRYCPNGNHKQYQENPRKGHNGTLEFTSLDAHKGVALSRRSDVEILGYCMLRWLCGKLPWERNLKDPVAVQTAKTKMLDELPRSVLTWAPPGSSCCELAQYLVCVSNLAYDEKPDYQKLKKILNPGGIPLGPLEFSHKAQSVSVHTPTHQKVDSRNIETKPASEVPDKFSGQVYREKRVGSTAAWRQGREEGQPRIAGSTAAWRRGQEEGQPRSAESTAVWRQGREEAQPRNVESTAAWRQGREEDQLRSAGSTAAWRQGREEAQLRSVESTAAWRRGREEDQPRSAGSTAAWRQGREEDQPRSVESTAAWRQGREEDQLRSVESTAAWRQGREEDQPRSAGSTAAWRRGREEDQLRSVESTAAWKQRREEAQPSALLSGTAAQENQRRRKISESSELLNEVPSLSQQPRYMGFQTSFHEPNQGLTSTDRIDKSRFLTQHKYTSKSAVGVPDLEGPSLWPATFSLSLSEDTRTDMYRYGFATVFLMILVGLALFLF